MADDEYTRKIESLQQYIPFLDNMIAQLKDPSKKNREQQLSKMESLHAMITDRKKKLKIETLNKCEDVITKLYQKVNHKPFALKKEEICSPRSTPASPSPSPEPQDFHKPLTIPTERLEPESHIPKIDIYSSAAESLRRKSKQENTRYSGKLPDLSKPPISLDDLKCLENDVHDKINENASLKELNEIRNKIATELIFENMKSINKSPTVTEKVVDSIGMPNRDATKKIDNFFESSLANSDTIDKNSPKTPVSLFVKPKPSPKILKEPASIFGSILSNIDERIIEDTKKKMERRNSTTSKDEKINQKEQKDSKDDDKKAKNYDLSGTKSFKDKGKILIKNVEIKEKEKIDNIVPIVEKFQPPQYRRLADKYNPKPRKQTVDADVDKVVTDIIEANMKFSPPKLPIMSKPEPPPPPPASLVKCARQMDFDVLIVNQPQHPHTNINQPQPLMNSVIQRPPLLSTPQTPMLSPPIDNFISDYARDDFNPPNHRRPLFEPPPSLLSNNRFIPPHHANQRFNPVYNNNFNRDSAPPLLDFQPPTNIQSQHQFNVGPPLLSPEIPHFHESKPNFGGGVVNREIFLPKEDLRWQLEDRRPSWDRREYDSRFRGPMTYKEHREMRENTRDPRLARDPRDNRERANPRDNRERDSVENKDVKDPRLNRDKSKDQKDKEAKERENKDIPEKHNRDPRLNREKEFERGRSRNRYESKFDRMYSATNKDSTSSRSRSKSSTKEKEEFISPLNSLYSGKDQHKTGKGYGVQPFRIPKKKKEEKEQVPETVEDIKDSDDTFRDDPPVLEKDLDDDNKNNSSNKIIDSEINTKHASSESNKEKEIKAASEEAASSETKTLVEDDKKAKSEPESISQAQTSEKEEPKATTEQTILAHFFSNLLSSQNKKDKKSALYSLISTFSDTFSSKELAKITKIINANDTEETVSDEDEDSKEKKSETKEENLKNELIEEEKPVIEEIEKIEDESEVIDTEEVIATVSKRRLRSRRISSTCSPTKGTITNTESQIVAEVTKDVTDINEDATDVNEDATDVNEDATDVNEDATDVNEDATDANEDATEATAEEVVVTVGERIKSRRRNAKPKKKCRSELDKLHEDIQEMFIRDGVLTASGRRMCNLLKDDPCALTNENLKTDAEEMIKTRKKPGPKSKSKSPSENEVRVMKHVRVMIQKIPDAAIEDATAVRRLTRSMTMPEEQEDESSVSSKERSDEEDNESGKESLSSTAEAQKTKTNKRKRLKSNWASGIIKKKKRKQQNTDDTTPQKSPEPEETSIDDFLTPDKNYYVDFAFKKTHSCRLCDFHGRYITTHFKTAHSDSEVMSSRFSPAVAAEAIQDAKTNLEKYEKYQTLKPGSKISYVCRFCDFSTTIVPTLFYDHLTTHTGEYRHICPNCNVSFCNGKTLKAHIHNSHPADEKPIVRKCYNSVIQFGYLCEECNYVQINKKNVEEHVNIYHLEKPLIHKINFSSLFDEKIEQIRDLEQERESYRATLEQEVVNETVKEKHQKVTKESSKPNKDAVESDKKKKALRTRPGPKSKKKFLTVESTATIKPVSEVNETSGPKAVVEKAKIVRGDVLLDTDKILPFRSKRAAKEKAQEKLKVMMEMNDSSSRKKTNPEENRTINESSPAPAKVDNKKDQPEEKSSSEKDSQSSVLEENSNSEVEEEEEEEEGVASEETTDAAKKINKSVQNNIEKVVKKEIEMNVFTCNTDIQEENKKIEEERLQKMDELNKSFGSRTSLNFIDKLCNRLNQNDILVKEEPKDDFVDTIYQSVRSKSPVTMPVLEKNPQIKKPLLESVQVSTTKFDVAQKNDKNIMNMIEKLKGKLSVNDNFNLDASTDDTDNDGPPPLTHVNELTNVKPTNASDKTFEVCGLLKVIKTDESTTFSCLVPPCVYSTDNKDQFQVHCKEHHANGVSGRTSTLCETCGMEINITEDGNLLENLFKHTIVHHGDFIKIEEAPKPVTPVLRIRKLSGDALSVIKMDKDEEVEKNELINDESSNEVDVTSIDGEPVEDNPFPFKIAGVMSLAEPQPQPPPLTPITKQSLPILVKEAKLTVAELSKPRKATKAMAKFVEDVGNLYKCPHFYCIFTTNFREFLERHLKAHNTEKDAMIPCVYCDLKTPWEHVAIHIDIRHSNCKYACSYCLYRACLKNYVFLHQDRAHQFLDYSVIALPTPKTQKKFAIADVKIDLKTLVEPYRCLPICNVEFLFENEFNQHLTQNHSGFLTCGHDDCSSRVMISKMIQHWSVAHNISVYQCGYCKSNSNELNLLYHHLSQMHQNLTPEILVRILSPKPIVTLGYTAEAFKRMRIIATLPNITEGEKGDVPAPSQFQEPAKSIPSVTHFPQTIQVVTNPNNVPRTIFVPATKVVNSVPPPSCSSSSTVSTSSNNLYLVANPSIGGQNPLIKVNVAGKNSLLKVNSTGQNSLLNINSSMGQQLVLSPGLSTTANISKVSTLSTQSPTISSVTPQSPTISTVTSQPVPEISNTLETLDANVVPLEHVTLNEETNPDEITECDVDPLDLGDTTPAQNVTYSSEDESDSAKSKKKFGLLGYQLFRCAFCEFSCSNSLDFRKHVSKSVECKNTDNLNKPFACVHCKKTFRNSHILSEHIQCHGVLRFSCSLCGNKFPTSSQARTHMKSRHNVSQTTQTVLNPGKISSGNEEYIIKPKSLLSESGPKEAASVEFSMPASVSDNTFIPEDIEKIPIRSIFSSDLRCGICTYSTKVRTNMVRHLQFHMQEKAVPDSAPVNPVPCLEKNEKMFDKMINLASSSHKTGSRMGGGNKAENKEMDTPKFVASHRRYTCCAQGCNYICPEEANLRHHLMALHAGETCFICVHCKAQLTPTDADSLIKHLKLHGRQLYKCQYCSIAHYLKHKIEKHCNDVHVDMPNKVITIRNLEAEPVNEDSATSTLVSNQNKGNKLWRCLMCKFRAATEDGIWSHIVEKHEIDTQYKCALCAYKTDDKTTFLAHFTDHHPKQDVDIIHSYRKFEEETKDEKEIENFDTTPLWQRDRPRIKHIRGILFDEVAPTPAKSPKKPVKVPSAAVKSATRNLDLAIESVATGSASVLKDDGKDFFDKVNQLLKDVPVSPTKRSSDVIVIDDDDEDAETLAAAAAPPPAPSSRVSLKRKSVEEAPQVRKVFKMEDTVDVGARLDDEEDEINLKKLFGDFGLPLNKQLKCPVCNRFKSKRISDFIFHLFKEKRVYRYKCGICGDESITYRYMSKHVKEHEEDFNTDYIIKMKRNLKLELWLQMLIRSQCTKIVPSLTQIDASSIADKSTVLCRYCNKSYKSEQERNEHALTHWSCIPFKCPKCHSTTYTRDQMEKHFAKSHSGLTLATTDIGPTVGGELQHADHLHMKEVQEELVPAREKEASIAEVMVPAISIPDMIDESDQDGTVQGMTDILDAALNVIDPMETPYEPVEDLVIVSKTDMNVPQSGDVYCCEYCPYISNSEPIMLSHISGQHEHMHIKFKVLNQRICEMKKDDFVSCMICHEIGSEIKIRQHHMKVHDGETFVFYRYTCNACNKKFTKLPGLKLHSQRVHPGVPVTYTGLFNNIIPVEQHKSAKEKSPKDKHKHSEDGTPNRNLLTVLTPAVRGWKRYQCTECSYQRDFAPGSVNNVRCHVRTHFKAFLCGECGLKFKKRTDAASHFRKEHPGVEENVLQDKDIEDSFQECMKIIHGEAIPIEKPTTVAQEAKGKATSSPTPTARKSTSAPHTTWMEEFSYYGNPAPKEDMHKIMTTVEINGICLDMTADKLGKIFDLNPIVAVTKCDADDESMIIEIDS